MTLHAVTRGGDNKGSDSASHDSWYVLTLRGSYKGGLIASRGNTAYTVAGAQFAVAADVARVAVACSYSAAVRA